MSSLPLNRMMIPAHHIMLIRTCSYSVAFVLIFLIAQVKSFAQNSNFYLSFNLGKGNVTSGGIRFEKGQRAFSYGLLFLSEVGKSKNVPGDYEPGLTIFGDGIPKTSLNSIGISIGKYYYLKNRLRVHLKAAPMITIIEDPANFRSHKPSCSGWGPCFDMSSNYDFDYKKTVSPSLLLNPILEIPVARKFAFFAEAGSNINKKYVTVYGGGGILVGFGGQKKAF